MQIIINIKDYYPSTIATRKAISILKDNITLSAGENYVFNFSGITFISRSFADEFLKYVKSSDIFWSFSNTNANIQAILNAVKKSQESTRSNFDYVAITKFETEKEFNQFLTTF